MKATKKRNCTFCKFIHWHQIPIADDLIEDDNYCEHPVSPVKNKVIDENYVCKRFVKHLNQISTQYKIAKRYGLVKEKLNPLYSILNPLIKKKTQQI